MARLAVGSDPRAVFPLSAIGGALLLLLADTVARTIGVPVGVITALIGAPFLLWLLHRARAGEFVLSAAVMDALGNDRATLQAEPLPPLEITRRDPVQLFGVLRDARLDFT